jgi:ATP-binding cassette subfamily F protein 3
VIEIRDGRCNEYIGNYSYFIKKRGEMTSAISGKVGERLFQKTAGASVAGNSPVTASPPEANETMPSRRSFKTREEKRLEAEERNRLSHIMRDFKKKLKALENHIIHLEEKKADSEKILCEPGIHREPQKIKMLNQELLDISRELENLYTSWNTLTQEIEAHEAGSNEGI